MADTQRIQTILTDFQKRMRKNGVTNKAIWAAFTSLPSISTVQFARRLNSYGITVTNREVSSLWKYVGIKTNSMNYDDFVKIMQASPSSLPSSARTKKRSSVNLSPEYEQESDDYNQRGGTAYSVARPRLGRNNDDQPTKKERVSSRPSTASNSKPHVKIDSKYMNPKKPSNVTKNPKVGSKYNEPEDIDDDFDDANNDDGYGENLYNGSSNVKGNYKYRQYPDDVDEDIDNYEDNEGSVASSSKYGRGKENMNYDDDDNEGSVVSSSKYSRGRGSVNYDDEEIEGSVASSSKYSRGRGSVNYDDEENEGSVASNSKYSRGKGSVNYDDDVDVDVDYTSYKSGKGSSHPSQKSMPKSNKYSPKKVNKSGIDDEILNQGTYDSADDDEDNYFANKRRPQYANEEDDDGNESQYSRRQPQIKRNMPAYDDDDDDYNNRNDRDDDDDDFKDKRFSKNGSSRSSSKKSQEPELFSRIPSSNSPDSPNRNPPSGGRRNLDPMIFGARNVSSASKSSRSSTPAHDQEIDEAFKGTERVSGISLKKLVSLISEHVYQNYPNGKSCYLKWRGIHSGIEAEDLRNGLARDSKILITIEDANKIISKYGGPLSLSTFSRMLSDGTRFAEEEKSGQQELTNDEEAILKIAHNVKGNKWEDMIYRAPDVVDIVNGFADMGIIVNEDDIRVLTQKIGKTGLVNAIRANM